MCSLDTRDEGKGDESKRDEGKGGDKCPLYIIGMSANSDNESVKDALAAGMNDFVMKPFNYEVLAARLKGVLVTGSRQMTHDSEKGSSV